MPRCGCPKRRGAYEQEGVRPRRIRRFVEPAVLLLLHSGPMHGYGLLDGLAALGARGLSYRHQRHLPHPL